MNKKYGILTLSIFSILTLLLVSCGRGNDDIRKMDTFDFVMSIFFVLLIGAYLDKPKKTSKVRRVFKVIFTIFLTLCLIGVLAVCAFFGYIVKNAPSFEKELLKEKEATRWELRNTSPRLLDGDR